MAHSVWKNGWALDSFQAGWQALTWVEWLEEGQQFRIRLYFRYTSKSLYTEISCSYIGMDTLHLAEENGSKDDYRPAFMDHFDRVDTRVRPTQKGTAEATSPSRQTEATTGAVASPQKDWRRSHTDFEYVRTRDVTTSFQYIWMSLRVSEGKLFPWMLHPRIRLLYLLLWLPLPWNPVLRTTCPLLVEGPTAMQYCGWSWMCTLKCDVWTAASTNGVSVRHLALLLSDCHEGAFCGRLGYTARTT